MRNERLKKPEVWEAIHSQVRSDQCLNRAADAEEIHEFVDGVVFCDEHQRACPHQQTAQVKRKHGLDRPPADDVIPRVPGDFVDQQNQCQCPADFALGRVAGVLETDEEKIQEKEKCQRAEVGCAEEIESRTEVIVCKELAHEHILPSKGRGTELQ